MEENLCHPIILVGTEDRIVPVSTQLTIAQLMRFKGIGEAKAVKIRAAMELSRRRREAPLKRLNKINSSLSVFELMHPLFRVSCLRGVLGFITQ